MKTFLIFFVASVLAVPSLFAKDLSLREKRLGTKTRFKIDKSIASVSRADESLFAEVKHEKSLRSEVPLEKTIRADKIGREQVFTKVSKPKTRRKTHFREWP